MVKQLQLATKNTGQRSLSWK